MSYSKNLYDTIVVGLGAAGVSAASTLARAGKRVLGLEADNRLGGRVRTVPFGDGVVELGAEWIQGSEHNQVYDFAVQNNVSLFQMDFVTELIRSNGEVHDRKLVNELIMFYKQVISESIASEKPLSLGQYFTSRLTDYLKEKHPEVLKDTAFVSEFLQAMHLYSNYEGTNDWDEISAQTGYVELKGHLFSSWHRHGYSTLFEIQLNTYNNGPGLPSLDIKLNKEVTQIKWPKDSTGDVAVTCKDGDTYTANNVIVTVSLGVLKERFRTMFSPMLPTKKIMAIDKLAYGPNGKIILSFPHKLPTSVSHYMFCWSAEDFERLDKDDKWLARLGPSVTLPSGSSNTLTLWTSGDVAKMIETLPEDVVINKTMEILRRFMGGNITIPEPTGIIRSTWFMNPFTRGSYSYDSIEMHQYPNARSILAEPLLDAAGAPRVLFAGEATDAAHFATVHGACDSGHREAMRLLAVKM